MLVNLETKKRMCTVKPYHILAKRFGLFAIRLPWGNQLLIVPIQRGCLARRMDWWMPRASLSVWRVPYLHLPVNLVLQIGNDQPCCLADHTLSAAGSGPSCSLSCQPLYLYLSLVWYMGEAMCRLMVPYCMLSCY